MKVKKYTLLALGSVALVTATFLSSCIKENPDSPGWEYMPDMYRSPAPEPNGLYISAATPDSLSNRMPAPGSIPRDWTPFPYENSPIGDSLASMFWKSPYRTSDSLEAQGQFLYERYCIYCHGPKGDGNGPLVEKGKFPNQPPSYIKLHDDGKLTPGHVYHVITYGKGVMGSHGTQLNPEERWKVIMYVERLGAGGEPWSVRSQKPATPAGDSTMSDTTKKMAVTMEPKKP